jgi:hypothetical protein
MRNRYKEKGNFQETVKVLEEKGNSRNSEGIGRKR